MMNVLVAYSKYASFVTTTYDYLESFKRIEGANLRYLNVVKERTRKYSLDNFDVVVVSYCARLFINDHVVQGFKDALRKFVGITCVCVQDEYDHVDAEVRELLYIKPDIVFSCVPEGSHEYVYGPLLKTDVKIVRCLTGYVPNNIPDIDSITPLSERECVIGYRARKLSLAYGDLGRMKFEIGPTVKGKCQEYGVIEDIEWDENKRIYGELWSDWLFSMKATLITESGSNIFDFDGSIKKYCEQQFQANAPVSREMKKLLASKEEEIDMAQISPRVFEALVHGCALIGYEGAYSGILTSDVHYISLKKDHSNIDSIMEKIQDDGYLHRIWEQAYNHVIVSGSYTYNSFASLVSTQIDTIKKKKRMEFLSQPVQCQYPYTLRPIVFSKRNRFFDILMHEPWLFLKISIKEFFAGVRLVKRFLVKG
jgi:hypothetical protein